MEVPTQASSKIMKYRAWASTFGLMERCMKDIGKRIKCTDKEY
jgi:hypothetical protein